MKKLLIRSITAIGVFFAAWQLLHLLVPWWPSPWPPFYWSHDVHGQVVDAGSGQPLAGVIVTAHWELLASGWTSSPIGLVAVMETVTDDTGHFVFSWSHPRFRLLPWGKLSYQAPVLLFFRSGYEWEVCSNSSSSSGSSGMFPTSDCDYDTIKLKKFTGTEKEYSENLQKLNQELEFAFRNGDCSWKKIPSMLVALDEEDKRLEQKNIWNSSGSIEYKEKALNSAYCGSIREFLRSH
jgi:hypothetical protein